MMRQAPLLIAVVVLLLFGAAATSALACSEPCTTECRHYGTFGGVQIQSPLPNAKFCPGSVVTVVHTWATEKHDVKVQICNGIETVLEECWDNPTYEYSVEPSSGGGYFVDNVWHAPCTPGDYTLKVTVRDHPCPGQQCSVDDTDFTRQVTVQILEPVHDLSILQPTGGVVGGITPVRVEREFSCGAMSFDNPKVYELSGAHPTDWTELNIPGTWSFETLQPPDEFTERYRHWCYVDTRAGHRGEVDFPIHNGSHTFRMDWWHDASNDCGRVEGHEDTQITICNLSVSAVDPPDHVTWDGENVSDQIDVTIVDDDLSNGPVDMYLDIYDCASRALDPQDWTCVRTMSTEGLMTTIHTFNWDGKDNSGDFVPPGAYTYDVRVHQHFHDLMGIRPDYYDEASYRSEFLSVNRAVDGNNEPIYEAEYDGIDDNGTHDDPDDDQNIYYIRSYSLTDYGNKDASLLQLTLYDPTMQWKRAWDSSQLQELEAQNPLEADETGVAHKVRVAVPIGDMDVAGDYRFMLHFEDDHADGDRAHKERPALDLNEKARVVGAAVYCTDDSSALPPGRDDTPNGQETYDCLTRIWNKSSGKTEAGYRGWSPLGQPEVGGSGIMVNKAARPVIRTLNRLCPTEVGQGKENYRTRNAVWVFYGHSQPDALQFPNGTGSIENNREIPAVQVYNIGNFSIGFVRLAYLAGCGTAGGQGNEDPKYNASQQNSIAASFHGAGAHAVVAFRNLLYTDGTAFREFNRLFWQNVCRKGKSVRDAATEASRGIGWWARYSSHVPTVRVIGNGKEVLFPVAYGP